MPYFITDTATDCAGWGVVKDDGELLGCHDSKQSAIDQMVALSIAEDIEPGGERVANAAVAVITDIDDTIIRNGTRPVRDVIEHINSLPGDLFVITGREERQRETTVTTLSNAGLRAFQLLMRPDASVNQISFKIGEAERIAETYRITHVFENDADTRDAYSALGLTVLNPMDFEVTEDRELPDNYRPALSEDVPEGRACGNCFFYDDTNVSGDMAWCNRWEDYVRGDYYCNAWQEREGSARFYTERVEMQNVEVRTFDAEVRAVGDDANGMTFGGYAWRYGEPSLPLPFTERIEQGAFTRTLKSRNDVRAYYNHNDELLLGSTRAKTLRIEDRPDGGYVEIDLPDTEIGRSTAYHIRRGDITGMSFGFSTVRDDWSADGNERTLQEVRLHEVSVVSGVPAYPSTTASVRNLKVIAHRTEMDADELSDAMTALQAGELSDDQANILRTLVDKMTGKADEPEQTVPLSVLQKQMDLLAKAF